MNRRGPAEGGSERRCDRSMCIAPLCLLHGQPPALLLAANVLAELDAREVRVQAAGRVHATAWVGATGTPAARRAQQQQQRQLTEKKGFKTWNQQQEPNNSREEGRGLPV